MPQPINITIDAISIKKPCTPNLCNKTSIIFMICDLKNKQTKK